MSESKFKISETIEDTIIDVFILFRKTLVLLRDSIFKIKYFVKNVSEGQLENYTRPYTYLTFCIILASIGISSVPLDLSYLFERKSIINAAVQDFDDVSIVDIIWRAFPVLATVVLIDFSIRKVGKHDFYTSASSSKYLLLYITGTQFFLVFVYASIQVLSLWAFKLNAIDLWYQSDGSNIDIVPEAHVFIIYFVLIIIAVILIFVIPFLAAARAFGTGKFSSWPLKNLFTILLIPFVFILSSSFVARRVPRFLEKVQLVDNFDLAQDFGKEFLSPIDWLLTGIEIADDKLTIHLLIQKHLTADYMLRTDSVLVSGKVVFPEDTTFLTDYVFQVQSGKSTQLKKGTTNNVSIQTNLKIIPDFPIVGSDELRLSDLRVQFTSYPRFRLKEIPINEKVVLKPDSSLFELNFNHWLK